MSDTLGMTTRRCMVLIVVSLAVIAAGTMAAFVMGMRCRRWVVERSIGASLPGSTTDVHYYRFRPMPDSHTYYVYLRFRTTKADYLRFMESLGVPVYPADSPQLRLLLPGKWSGSLVPDLRWWDPSDEIPEDTGMLNLEQDGYTVAKYEDGYVYLRIFRPDWFP